MTNHAFRLWFTIDCVIYGLTAFAARWGIARGRR